MKTWMTTAALALIASGATADDAALILGVERYRDIDRVAEGDDVVSTRRALADFGFTVFAQPNVDGSQMRQTARQWLRASEDSGRLVAVLSGQFVTDGRQTWLLSSDVDSPTLFDVPQFAISVDSVTTVLEQAQGQAILVLGHDGDSRGAFADGIRFGLGPIDVGQGVTVIDGAPGSVANFVERVIARPGADITEATRSNQQVRLRGYAPPGLRLIAPDQSGQANAPTAIDPEADTRAWRLAEREDTIPAYRAYIADSPDGAFVDAARQAISDIQNEPNRAARLAEEALGLSRQARSEIQRDLSVLDYNTRGIDGIFGTGTRRAIQNWQQQNGLGQTGYLTGNQIGQLDAQATQRSQELAAAAQRARQQENQRDRAYWDQTGADRTEASTRAYLERYPDGLFAEQAEARLEEIAAEKRRRAAVADREQWDRSSTANSIASYRRYLELFPEGDFASNARARISQIETRRANSGAVARAAEAEANLGLDPKIGRAHV